MANKTVDTTTEIIKKALESKHLIIGTERSLKAIRQGKAKQIFLTANCPDTVREDIERGQKFTNVEVVQLLVPNDELGIICRKTFPISVVAIIQ